MDDFYMVPLAPVITGVTCSYIPHSLSFHSKVIIIIIIIIIIVIITYLLTYLLTYSVEQSPS